MAKTTSLGFTDTADGGATTKAFTRANLNFPVDFSVKTDSESKVLLVNKTSPLDQLESIRVESSNIVDVYKGTSIDPSVYAPSRQGVSIVVQVNDVLRVTDAAVPAFQLDLPISVHTVVKVPLSSYITAADVQTVIGRALAIFYNSNYVTTGRISSLLRGSMLPAGL